MGSGKGMDAATASRGPDEGGSTSDLEAGIAAVFARLRATGDGDDAGFAREPTGAAVDDGTTFDLLGELDRLWRGDA